MSEKHTGSNESIAKTNEQIVRIIDRIGRYAVEGDALGSDRAIYVTEQDALDGRGWVSETTGDHYYGVRVDTGDDNGVYNKVAMNRVVGLDQPRFDLTYSDSAAERADKVQGIAVNGKGESSIAHYAVEPGSVSGPNTPGVDGNPQSLAEHHRQARHAASRILWKTHKRVQREKVKNRNVTQNLRPADSQQPQD